MAETTLFVTVNGLSYVVTYSPARHAVAGYIRDALTGYECVDAIPSGAAIGADVVAQWVTEQEAARNAGTGTYWEVVCNLPGSPNPCPTFPTHADAEAFIVARHPDATTSDGGLEYDVDYGAYAFGADTIAARYRGAYVVLHRAASDVDNRDAWEGIDDPYAAHLACLAGTL